MPPKQKSKNQVAVRGRQSAAHTKVTRAPVAIGVGRRTGEPKLMATHRGVRVRHTEYVEDCDSDINFATYNYAINPGNPDLFPWLSGIALNYESYRIHHLEINLVSQVPTDTKGYLAAAIDYDAADPAPASKQAMLNFSGAERVACWQQLKLRANTRDLNKLGPEKFCRFSAVADTDIKTYDSGNIYTVMSTPVAAVLKAYEFNVTYDIEFFTPQLRPNEAAYLSGCRFNTSGTATKAAPWTDVVRTGGELIAMSTANPDSAGFTIRDAATYLANFQAWGTGVSSFFVGGADAIVTAYSSLSDANSRIQNFLVERIGDTGAYPGVDAITDAYPNFTLALTGWSTVSAISLFIAKMREQARATSTLIYEDKAKRFQLRVADDAPDAERLRMELFQAASAHRPPLPG